jgi:hypothetical protein
MITESIERHLFGDEIAVGMYLLHEGQALPVLGVRPGNGANIHLLCVVHGVHDEVVVRKNGTYWVHVPLDWELAATGRLPRQRRAS